MDFKPLSVLVTGSSGFIGTHVVRHLTAAGHRIIGYDRVPPKEPFPDGSIYLCGDIRTDRLPFRDIDAVVHLAALAGVRPSMDRPFDYLSTNVTGTLRLLDHCRVHGIPHFVFASSSSVYGPDTPLPAEETTTPDPCSPYALTKLHGEQWGRLYSRLHGLRFLALRFFSVWGPGQRSDLALESFRRRIEAGEPVIIHGDGSHRRDLTHVEDVARAVELALHWPGPGADVLNIGTGKNHSVMDMLDAARKAAAALQISGSSFTHFTPPVVHQNPHPADVPETRASLVAVGKKIGWNPRIFFPETAASDVKKV
jgi:UDP-glucuronate 4-epimerase